MAGQQLGYPCFRNEPMDAASAAVVWSKYINTGSAHRQTFFWGHFGIPLTAPEQEIQKTFTSTIVEPSLPSATIREGEQVIVIGIDISMQLQFN
jgi:hypothetical protein